MQSKRQSRAPQPCVSVHFLGFLPYKQRKKSLTTYFLADNKSNTDRFLFIFGFVCRISVMPIITVLPHADLCPEGASFSLDTGISICDGLLKNGIDIEHACEKSCACTTCHIVVQQGFVSLTEATEDEEDLLDRAWGLTPSSRLSCQSLMGNDDLTIQIPRYTINHAREHH